MKGRSLQNFLPVPGHRIGGNMKRKLMAILLSCAMTATILAGCGGAAEPAATDAAPAADAAEDTAADTADTAADTSADTTTESATPASGGESGTINLWAFTDEVPGMVDKYVAEHPDFP